jgi:hypothetical protein
VTFYVSFLLTYYLVSAENGWSKVNLGTVLKNFFNIILLESGWFSNVDTVFQSFLFFCFGFNICFGFRS